MVRSMYVGMAALLWFARAVSAQPLNGPPAQTSLEWPSMAGSAAAAATEALETTDQQPAGKFAELRRRISNGDTIYVVDASGRETRGRVATLSDVALAVTVDGVRQEFAADRVSRIDRRRRDPVRNGLLMGAGAGAAAGYWLGRSADSASCRRSSRECGQGALIGTVGGVVWGAVGGWITDLLIRKREIIYLPHGST